MAPREPLEQSFKPRHALAQIGYVAMQIPKEGDDGDGGPVMMAMSSGDMGAVYRCSVSGCLWLQLPVRGDNRRGNHRP